MPSLSPGTSGAKEAYGVCVLTHNNTITIPPKAFLRYNLKNNHPVLLTSTRQGERGFAILNIDKAKDTVFGKIIDKIPQPNEPVFIGKRPYAITVVNNNMVTFNSKMLAVFELKSYDKFLVIKSTTVTMSFNPVDVFISKLEKHGFFDAVKNIDKLEVF